LKKLLLGLAALILLLVGAWLVLVQTGTISSNSLAMVLNVATGRPGARVEETTAKQTLQLPDGFSVGLYANDLPRARFLRFTSNGDLLVSRPHSGDIILLQADSDGDGRADGRSTVIAELNRPQGMDFHGEWLYIAEREQIGRIRFDQASGTTEGDYETVVTGLTGDGNHWSKTLRFGPDGMMYLAQGSTCNICEEADERRATMMRFQPDGSAPEIVATGLRNSVGFDWAPWDNGLYATDNGRDMLGDDFPPCELNLVEQGRFYGWPYFNGDNIVDPDMGADPLAGSRQPTAPAHNFRAHNAPLGIDFVDTAGWPAGFDRVALVALHGSWNRSVPDGYKVVSLHFGDNGIEERDFLSGFNQQGDILGRPVDVQQGPDGALYISDDYAAAVYRVALDQPGSAAAIPLAGGATRLDTTPPSWLAEADLDQMSEAGAALYEQFACHSCHEQGENPRLLTGLNERLGYNAVIDVLQAPRAPMPLFPLSLQQQRELAAYLLTRP
jgi:glucose/arabinose dehydrogenase